MQGIRLIVGLSDQIRQRSLPGIHFEGFGEGLEDFWVRLDPNDFKAVVSVTIAFLADMGADVNKSCYVAQERILRMHKAPDNSPEQLFQR